MSSDDLKNPNCDGSRCVSSVGEVRVLPVDNTEHGSNVIVCFECYCHELVFRHQRNKELNESAQFPFPKWENLKVYRPE